MVLTFQKPFNLILVLSVLTSLSALSLLSGCKPSVPKQTILILQQIDSLKTVIREQQTELEKLSRLNTDSLVVVLSTYQLQDNNDDSFLQARSESIENAKNALQSFKTEAPILIGECKSQTDQLIQLHQIVDQKLADSTAQQAMLLVQRKAIEEQKIKNSYYLNRINAQLLLIETLTNTAKP